MRRRLSFFAVTATATDTATTWLFGNKPSQSLPIALCIVETDGHGCREGAPQRRQVARDEVGKY